MFCKGRIGAEPHRRKQEFTRHSLRSELEIVPDLQHNVISAEAGIQ